jgi:hypothetical protein
MSRRRGPLPRGLALLAAGLLALGCGKKDETKVEPQPGSTVESVKVAPPKADPGSADGSAKPVPADAADAAPHDANIVPGGNLDKIRKFKESGRPTRILKGSNAGSARNE